MKCPNIGIIDKTLTITTSVISSTGVAVDADSAPTYSIYAAGSATPILTGSMTKLATGLYYVTIDVTTANGFEADQTYIVHGSATVSGTAYPSPPDTFLALGRTDLDSAALGTDMAEVGQGTVTKAEILTRVNANTIHNETDIDEILKWALLDLSKRGVFLRSSVTGTVPSDLTVSLAANFYVEEFVSGDGCRLSRLTYGEYKHGRIQGYTIRNNELYFPESCAGKAYEIYYTLKHGIDVDTINFGEEYREALVVACTAKVFKKYQQYADHDQWIGDYEYEARKLADSESDDMPVVQVRTEYRE